MYRLAVLLLCSALVFAQTADPNQIFQKALSLHKAGDLEGAIREYRAYLKLKPAAVDARTNLGAVLARTGHYEDAITEYKQALKGAAENPGIWLNLGLAHYKAFQLRQAAEAFATVRAIQPANKQATMLLADCYLRTGENKKVIELLEPIQKDSADDLAVIYLLGSALIRDKQPEKGQVLIDKILRNGESAEARLLLGTTKLLVRDNPGALEDLGKAVQLNPELPEVHAYYGEALLFAGDPIHAAEEFKKELEHNPNDFTSNLQLGVLAKQDQEHDVALTHLKRALLARPGDFGVRYQLATVLLSKGDMPAAQKELESLIRESPEFTEAHVSLATVYYRLKRKEDGDRERAIVQQQNAARQAKEPGAQSR